MTISIIAAFDNNRVIGNKGRIPWLLPADLKHFKECTMGKPIIMGRTTHQSIGKILPGRLNIVITRGLECHLKNIVVAHSVREALYYAAQENTEEVMVIGGSTIYRQFLSATVKMYLTLVDAQFEGDAFFPEFDVDDWLEVEKEVHDPDDENPVPYTFLTLKKRVLVGSFLL
ncbi:MAG: dihydrofolate reductase [Candidatus Yanofskybacteria bacterium]|nr:dihydrofolate reductase [Candidatus Yanofskybacteria bacterium]